MPTIRYLQIALVVLLSCTVVSTANAREAATTAQTTALEKSAAPVINIAAIEKIMADEMQSKKIPGAALAIVHNGNTLYAKGFGRANLEHDVPVTPDSVFLIASVSKPILAMGVMLLAQQGKLNIDDPLSKYLTDTPESWRDITLRHLMNHTAGLVRESPAFDGNKAVPNIDLIRATYPLPLDFPTGTKIRYCNICYFTLAEVISRVSGEPWPTFMEKNIFSPAGLRATRTSSTSDVIANRAASYSVRNGVYSIEREYIPVRPSGAFASSLNDIVRLEKMLVQKQLLNADTIARMQQPATLKDGSKAPFDSVTGAGYGLGWVVSNMDGQLRVGHGGSLAGFRTLYQRYPERGVAIIVLTNLSTARPNDIEAAVAKVVFAK
jgi:D-alanyl-D-alanine carboxypeptidase